MNNQVQEFPHSEDLLWTNGTGSTAPAGTPVFVKGRAYVPVEDIANGASGMLAAVGRFKLPKTTGQAYVQGQPLYWDAATGKVTSDSSAGKGVVYFTSPGAAAAPDTECEVNLGFNPRVFRRAHTVSAGEDAANLKDFTHSWGANPAGVVRASVRSTAGVVRVGQTITFPDTNTIRVADANLAVNEIIDIEAWEF